MSAATILRRIFLVALFAVGIVVVFYASALAQADPLPSWNGAVKKSISDFVVRVTTQGGPDFVPVSERIATFDNDGTLWTEQPYYFQFAFALDRIRAMAPGDSVPVTVDNFIRAESDLYFRGLLKDSGGIGRFLHRREPARIDNQTVIRLNRDTLYSSALFDLDAGPVTVTLPDAGKRFMSMQVINEDHYVPEVIYGKGSYTLTKEKVGTHYVAVAIRTLVDPANPKDIEQVHALQDGIKVSQKDAGSFEAPKWDQASQKKVRDALIVLASTIVDFKKAFGTKEQVDPVRHLIGTAAAWGGNPDKDATYLNVTPAKNDGTTVYKLSVKDVPVDAFWSVSVYNAEGYYEKNPYDAYTLNNITAEKSGDGAIAIQFGGCDGKMPNCLPITKGWNYTVRLYRPRPEILSGKWKFPEPQPVS
jgi:hypothetical protein